MICTRPREQNESWQRRLIDAGFNSIVQPLLEIKPLTDLSQIQKIKQTTLNLDHYQKIVFVSQNAVRFGLDCIESYWPECPLGISWFAVGSKTAEVLKAGLQQRLNCFSQVNETVGTEIKVAKGAMNSESLLAMPELGNVAQEKILIARGLGGRPHLAEVLTERGASVDLWELYERSVPDDVVKHYRKLFSQYKNTDVSQLVFSIFSGETLENFDSTITGVLSNILTFDSENHDQLVHLVKMIKTKSWILVPGNRVNQLAKNKGFKNIICAENASENAMVSALKNTF